MCMDVLFCVVTVLEFSVAKFQFKESESSIQILLIVAGSALQQQIIVSLSTHDISTQG